MSSLGARRIRLAALLVLLGAVAAHCGYWYGTRWHALPLDRAELLPAPGEDGSYLWIPFPHQNLRSLERAVGRPGEILAAAGRLAGREELAVPRLGFLGVPPGRELLVTWTDGEPSSVRYAVYPFARWVLRAAGGLASNPLLAGGDIDGRRQVSWEDGVWRMASPGPPERAVGSPTGEDPSPGSELDEIWARWRQGDPAGSLPAGTYDLRFADGSLCLLPPGGPLAAPALPESATLVGVERTADGPRMIALAENVAGRSGLLDLPGFVVAAPTREEAAALLPAMEWLDRVADLPGEPTSGGALLATEAGWLPLGRRILEEWVPWMESRDVGVVAMVDPARAALLADDVADFLEDVPLASRSTRRRWRDVATLLEALSAVERVCVVATRSTARAAEDSRAIRGAG